MKKVLTGWLAVLMLFSMIIPASLTVSANEAAANEVIELEVSRDLFSLTEVRTVEVAADLGEGADLDNIEFLFGGKPLSEWRRSNRNLNFNGSPWINVIEGPSFLENSTAVTATLEFGLPYNTTNLSNRTLRTHYQQLIGNYELAMVDAASGTKAAAEVKLNVYDEFLFYDELKPAIDEVIAAAEADEDNDRYLEYQKVGESVEGRDIHFVILARDEEAVDRYLNETLPLALEDPASLIEQLENDTLGDYQVPIWFNNIHPDEVEGVDAQVELLKKFALEDEVTFNTSDGNNNEFPATLDMDEVLDDVIFLYMFTNNPDGRVANTRGNANGFDLNRDNANQTQVETQQVNEIISKWTPLSFLDMHGYVNGFLIEPTTPPHNPNFEYDLLVNEMLEQAHAMGRAGVGNSQLNSYFIPRLDWDSGWDDMTPAYTGMYAMLHGSLGHTIEVPELSQDSLHAMVGTGYGATLFVTENKDDLFKNQLEIFERGVNGEDNRAVDQYFVNAAGESIGRVRGDNENFFPDYYVIAAEEGAQKNVLEAYKMAEYLLRNGVKVERTTEEINNNGSVYPKGTFIVPMNQAKRGLANAMLYPGDDVSDWSAMYDPIVVNFPALRGFDIEEVRESGVFDGLTTEVESVDLPTGDVVGNTPKQIVKNNTNDAIKLVNDLLAEGKTVEWATEDKGRIVKGDFIVATSDLRPYTDKYYFETLPLGNGDNFKTSILSQPGVALTGSAQMRFSLNQLGFNLVGQADADVIVSDGSSFNRNNVEGKDFIGIGVQSLNAVRNSGALPGFSWGYTRTNHEGLVKAVVHDHLLTSGYQEEENLYITTGAWIDSVPEGADVLAEFADTDDFYLAGWWPGNQGARGKIMAFTHDAGDTKYSLFANDLAFRAHTEHSYRLLANSIFASAASEPEAKRKQQNKPGKGNAKANNLVVTGDSVSAGKTVQVDIPVKTVKNAKKNAAALEVKSGEASYVIPFTDLDFDSLKEVKGNGFSVSVEISAETEELHTDREEKAVSQKVSTVKVYAKSGNKKEEMTSFQVIE
ncbi:M14 family metallopeptidase [Evansella clarkii]|uniref:M14 family metallopeptidase n=1 Tax=Evansella clarkii TaxID=79879 RepID=UPI001115C6B6|nr:M14 family metallopeptidase [Evansella clarkii]